MRQLLESEVREFMVRHLSGNMALTGHSTDMLVDDTDLLSSGIIDSLGVIELIAAVEQHFEIALDLETLNPEDLPMIGKFSRFVAASTIDK